MSLLEENSEDVLVISCQLRASAKRCCVDEVVKQCLILEKQIEANDLKGARETLERIREVLRRIQDEYPPNVSFLLS
ncbi:hypothetical protein [[Limnothrix rosea] IAM M-220]|uniref:hypothetical protein n=1 Tax=[Limnothrix rosea] IAM M-220 TaxID=454133 RepID=UPI001115874D|nr:hypothetical protein [[Limnothrix rosea] IAM M-220]